MSDFARGARVRTRVPESSMTPLTMNEASFVMVDVARRFGGITTMHDFLKYMGRAWIAYERVASDSGDNS